MKNLRKSLSLILALVAFGQIVCAQTFDGGSGTRANPYIISNLTQWNDLVDAVNNGTGNYASAYYQLNGDVTAITTMVGTEEHPFRGTFDGNSHKLGIYYRDDIAYYAPFRYVNGATFKNLYITGSTHTPEGGSTSKCVASLIAHSVGNTTITNCHSDVQLNTNVSGIQHNGGFVAEVASGSLTITGCLFDGEQLVFNGGNQCGGFVGWLAQGATLTIKNCMLDPYAGLTFAGEESFSFVCAENGSVFTLTNCYYVTPLEQAQGKKARYIVGGDGITVAFDGNATSYSLSDIVGYDASPGLLYKGTLYAGEGDLVKLNISNTIGATSYLINTEPLIGDGNPYSITMPNEDINIYTTLTGTGTQTDPYHIYTASDFHQIGTLVANGQTFGGQYIHLENDISVTRMIGDDSHRFCGTFDGNGKTITVNLTATDIYGALFSVVDGATIHDLTVTGILHDSRNQIAGGIVGKSCGTTTLTNCICNVTLDCTFVSAAHHGGIVARNEENGNLTINGCAFIGKMLGNKTYECGGFVGFNAGSLSITNSLFSPTEVTINTQNCKTFAYYILNPPSITNSYYTQALGEAQGERTYYLTIANGITSSVIPFFGRMLSPCGATITLACDSIPLGYEPVFTVESSDNQNVTVNHVDNEYSFTMPDKNVTVTLSYNALPMTGDGTQDNPYIIVNADQWNTVVTKIFNQDGNYVSAYYRLDADISIDKTMGQPDRSFKGTFDGNGHTITLNYIGMYEGQAPFRVVENATIRNLHVNGSSGGSNYTYDYLYYLGGLVGFANGTVTIENCRVSSYLHIHTYGGGIVGHGQSATLNLIGCVFDGTILNTTNDTDNSQGVGGLVGWANNDCTMNFTNCLFAGTYTCDGSSHVPFGPIACSVNGSNTTNVINTYYTIDPDIDPDNNPNNIVSTTAKRAYSISGGDGVNVTFTADATTHYDVSDLSFYAVGVEHSGNFYACNNDQVSLQIDAAIPEGAIFMSYVVSSGKLSGTDNPYTLILVNDDVVINLKTAEEWEGEGTLGTPYLIYNSDQLDLLAARVNAGNDYEDIYFKLMNDIAYNPNVLTVDHNGDGVNESNFTAIGNQTNYFRGNFDGDGHTISGIRMVKSASCLGLFGRCVDGEIKNLILSDADITGNNYTGGIAGYSGSNLTNCHVTPTVTIRAVQTRVKYHGGLVGYNYMGSIRFCSSSATLTIENGNSNCTHYGSITGHNQNGEITDNFVIGSTIPLTSNSYGVIVGNYDHNNNRGTLQRNYYYDCTVTGYSFTTEIGCNGNDLNNTSNPDGAMVSYLLTLEDGITSSAPVITIPAHKDLNNAGTGMETIEPVTYHVAAYRSTVTLNHTLPAGYTFDYYTVRGEAISGNSFTMPSHNVAVGMVFSVEGWTGSYSITGHHGGDNGWNLIASPVGTVAIEDVTHLCDNEFDLYRFNQAADKEWENYKSIDGNNQPLNSDFTTLECGRGYLYANSEDVTLIFTGTPYIGDGKVTLSKTTGVEFEGWNLVGNPFATTAYIDRPFYVMNSDGSEIIAAADANQSSIAPMEGVFVIAEEDGETLTFTTAPQAPQKGGVVLNLSKAPQAPQKGGVVIDRAIVRFGEGRQLPKFQMRSNSTKVYIPQDGKDYAMVNVRRDGACTVSTEIPVNFKAQENGTYTLTISGVFRSPFSVLRLIDNLTGADIDLLQTPSYTFEARTTDYESRFKLVFATGDTDETDTFAFFSNGEIIVNGEGTLQVIDMLGRVIVQRRDGACTVSTQGMTAGVYVLRLINGDNVKTQKIVIE